MQMDYSEYNPVASFEERAFEKYLNVEEEFMAAAGYADSKEAILRKIAVFVIVENSKCENFDAFVPYLALNYFDRFISRNPLPNVLEQVRDEIILVANCCLMLAWKTRYKSFQILEFLAKTNMIEHQRHILPVELVILNGLNWQLRAVTAICFVDMLVRRIPVAKSINRKTMNQIVIQAQGDISYTRFKPSVIAAAAILSACKLLYGHLYEMCYRFLVDSEDVNEAELKACHEMTYEMCIEKRILIERDKKEPQIRGTSQAAEPSISISQGPGKEQTKGTSEIQEIDSDRAFKRRPGKEPIHEITEIEEEPVLVPKSKNDPDMDFELKWMLWNRDAAEITVDSSLFRPVAVAAETTSAENDNHRRAIDRIGAVSCSPLQQCTGCNYL